MQLKINNLLLNAQVKGNGTPIIFIHGYTTTSGFWQHQIPELASEYKVISFDLRGHGDSEKPEHVNYTIEVFSEDLRKIMESLDITSAVLVGLSMGGAIVQRFALDHPHMVRSLILVGTTAYGVGPMVQAKNVIIKIDEMGVEEASKEVIRHSFSSTTSQNVVKWAEKEVIKTPVHVAKQAIESLDSFDVRNEIHSLNIPTLIIVGEEDDITPVKESEYLYHNMKDSELHVIPKAAHFPMLEQPYEFNSHMLKFLSGSMEQKLY